jgi:hypothetical protein
MSMERKKVTRKQRRSEEKGKGEKGVFMRWRGLKYKGAAKHLVRHALTRNVDGSKTKANP